MFKFATDEQFWSLLRTVIQSAGAALVALGSVSPETVEHVMGLTAQTQILVGAVANIATTTYSLWIRRKAGIVATAAALPEVHRIEAAPEIAKKVLDSIVVASR